jgi:hypothetical protein
MSEQIPRGLNTLHSSLQHPLRWRSRLLVVGGLAAALLTAGAAVQPPRIPKQKKDKTPSTTAPANPKNSNQPAPAAPKSLLDDILKKGRTHDWTLKVSIHLDSYQDPAIYVTPHLPDGSAPDRTPGNNTGMPTIVPFKFDTAAVVFPALKDTAGSMSAGEISAKMLFDVRDVSVAPVMIENLPAGARYGRWDMKDKEGRTIDLDVELPVTTWEVMYDEQKAAKAVWPASGKWSAKGTSALGPVLFGRFPIIDPNGPTVREAVNTWTAGKSPQSIPPVQLAKFLAAKVLDTVQPSGDGLVSSRTGLLQGFDLRGSEATLKEGRGNEHDIACVLCAVYRSAGLPARTVIGYDVTESKGQGMGLKRKPGGAVRSWVEFCLVDETVTMPSGGPKDIWIPVDIARQRKSSSKAPPIERPWKFFGSNDETDDVIPIAFDYHPPLAGVVAHGSPCFWGWMTTPEMQRAEQTIRFTANTTARTGTPGNSGGNK